MYFFLHLILTNVHSTRVFATSKANNIYKQNESANGEDMGEIEK